MPLYQIRRDLPGASAADIDAASFRAIVCATEFAGVHWIRSYWDEPGGVITCYYEAPDAQTVRDHAARSRIPCDEILEVAEVLPESYVPDGAAFEAAGAPGEGIDSLAGMLQGR
ncbi:MAG: nickel-binding protein [Dehalococcoidia bacterium]